MFTLQIVSILATYDKGVALQISVMLHLQITDYIYCVF